MIGAGMKRNAETPWIGVGSRLWSLVLLLALCGCNGSEPSSVGRPVPSNEIADFSTLYNENCRGCHGPDGKFGPAPPLNDPIFLAIVPDKTLHDLVSGGRPGTPMPAFSQKKGGPLTDKQVQILAEGIKPRWGTSKPASTDLPAYAVEKSETAGDKGRGLKVFSRACSSCHGDKGQGNDEMAGPIHDPAFLALISDQCLRRIAITGRPDLGMPDFAKSDGRDSDYKPLTSQDLADLAALLADWREAGTAVSAKEHPLNVEKTRVAKSEAR